MGADQPRASFELREGDGKSDSSSISRRSNLLEKSSSSSGSSVSACTALSVHAAHRDSPKDPLPSLGAEQAPLAAQGPRSCARDLARSDSTPIQGPFSSSGSGQHVDLWWVATQVTAREAHASPDSSSSLSPPSEAPLAFPSPPVEAADQARAHAGPLQGAGWESDSGSLLRVREQDEAAARRGGARSRDSLER